MIFVLFNIVLIYFLFKLIILESWRFLLIYISGIGYFLKLEINKVMMVRGCNFKDNKMLKFVCFLV